MSAAPRHRRVLASAGSGKTYQLSSRYLGLMHQGIEPSTLLASTFTRLAGGEIRDRILQRAAKAVLDPAERDALATSIAATPFTHVDACALLDTLIDQLPSLQIRTLDGLLASWVRVHALDVDLPPHLDILDQVAEEDVQHESLRLMLDENDPQSLIDMLRALTKGQSNRSVLHAMQSHIALLLGYYRDSDVTAWMLPPCPHTPMSKQDAASACVALREVDISAVNAKFLKRHSEAVQFASTGNWVDFLGSDGLGSALAGKYNRSTIPDEVIASYTGLVPHAIARTYQQWQHELDAAYALMRDFDARERTYKRGRAVLAFSDLAPLVGLMHQRLDMHRVLQRIGVAIDHVMLDEFQDTSVDQWRALRPLLDRMCETDSDRSLFVVGDVKQSIYAWREATSAILESVPELLDLTPGVDLADDHLVRSYRSSPAIMRIVNAVFTDTASNAALADTPASASWWDDQFEPHETAKTDLPGVVRIDVCPKIGGRDYKRIRTETCQQWCVETVTDLHERFPHKTIGILTRSNEAVNTLMFKLGPDGQDLPVAGKGGRPLTDAAPINAMLDAIRLIDHPDDTIAAFNVAHSPLGTHLNFSDHADTDARRMLADRLRRDMMAIGLSSLLADWLRALAGQLTAWEQRRTEQLVAMALELDSRRSPRVREFLRHVDGTNAPMPGEAPITVMTVHQSKGLEFDFIVLPELDGQLKGQSSGTRYVRHRDTVDGPITRVLKVVNEQVRSQCPELQPFWDADTDHRVREGLCMLYVAMTRARQGLFACLFPPSDKRPSSSFSGMIYDALRNPAVDLDHREHIVTVYADGEFDALQTTADDAHDTTPVQPLTRRAPVTITPATTRWRGAVPAPSAHDEHHTTRSMAQLLAPVNRTALDHGTAIHAMFECVRWSEDQPPTDDQLRAAMRGAMPRHDRAWMDDQIIAFRPMMQGDAVRNALSRGARPDDRAMLHRELPFARLVDGGVQRGVIDRLDVTLDASGTPVSATVIDFKSDPVDDEALESRVDGYRGQIDTYRDVASNLLRLPIDQIRACLLFVATDKAVEW
ncbi:MAG: UvrD-helicase domain-containing protein [Planctomycetota bacterium]